MARHIEPSPAPPKSPEELLTRTRALAGQTLAQVARTYGFDVPPDLRRAKGWIGQLVEHALGARSSSKSQPDFVELGIELKTVPVDRFGRPQETTYVCTVSPEHIAGATWRTSRVRDKMSNVLWVPIETARDLALPDRRIGMPVLWQLDGDDEAVLKRDWTDLAELVSAGHFEAITGSRGEALHIRPKAANNRKRRASHASSGEAISAIPRGFYLRTQYTGALIQRALLSERRG